MIGADQLAAELISLGAQSIQPARDALVFCPQREWLEKQLNWFLSEPTARPIPGKRDCEDIVTKFVDRCSDALVEADSIPEGVGHSIGWAKVTITTFLPNGDESPGLNGIRADGVGTHMTAICRCDDSTWLFVEPQTGKYVSIEEAFDRGLVGVLLWCWV